MTKPRVAILVGAAGVVTILALFAWVGVAQAHVIERVSVAGDGTQGSDWAWGCAISADGRYVAFGAEARLMSGGTEGGYDIFVRDRRAGATERVSVSSAGVPGNDLSYDPAISADGRYVVFYSRATNLVDGDTNGVADIFVRDRQAGTTQRVSVAADGAQANDESSYRPSISPDGRYVSFTSGATNLVDGDTNGQWDVFVRDRQDATTERVSVATGGTEGNFASRDGSLSADGRFVAFISSAVDLVLGDTNRSDDVFVHDRQTGITERVNVANDGTQADNETYYGYSMSADGRYVTFDSTASYLVAGDTNGKRDVFVRDRQAATTTLVSVTGTGAQGNLSSGARALSADGRYVVFVSYATNLVSGDTNGLADLLVRDLQTGAIQRVNVSAGGAQANLPTMRGASISADNRYVAFESEAGNLVPGDTNNDQDIFVVVNPVTLTSTSLRGSDRYDTAIKISRALFPGALPADSGLVLAPGETFPEALCGAPLAAAYGGPVLLTPGVGLNNAVRAEILRLAPAYVVCIGLSDAIKDAVQTALGATGTAATITGADVYDMSYQVAKALGARLGDVSGATAVITRGDVFPDAIGVSPLACAQKWPILLTNSATGDLHSSAANALGELSITKALKVGTYATLPAGVAGLANLSGTDRYVTNKNVAEWAKTNAGLSFTHLGIATGDKFPDALAAGPYLAKDQGILLLSPLNGPVPSVIRTFIGSNATSVYQVSFIACIEPVIGQVKALLP